MSGYQVMTVVVVVPEGTESIDQILSDIRCRGSRVAELVHVHVDVTPSVDAAEIAFAEVTDLQALLRGE